MFGLAERTGARHATQHEEAQVVRVDGCIAVNYLTGFVVVVKVLAHEVSVLGDGLSGALPKHEIV
jgi:hypothetical protein